LTSTQAQQLEELLAFLGSLEPLAGLGRDRLTALAVCCAHRAAEPGSALLQPGEQPHGLVIIREGEVKLLIRQRPLQPEQRPQQQAGRRQAAGKQPSGKQPGGRRRVTFDVSELPALRGGSGGAAGAAAAAGGGQRGPRASEASGGGAGGGGAGEGVLLGGGQASPQRLQLQLSQMRPALVLAAGESFGEEAAGAAPGEGPPGPLAAGGREVQVMAVAARACQLLVLPAADMRRFGRRLLEPLRAAAARRREFLAARAEQLLGGVPPGPGPGAARQLPEQPGPLQQRQQAEQRAAAAAAAPGGSGSAPGSRRATAEAPPGAGPEGGGGGGGARRAAAVAASAGRFTAAAMYTASLAAPAMQLPPLPPPPPPRAAAGQLLSRCGSRKGAALAAAGAAVVAEAALQGPAPLISGRGRAMERLGGRGGAAGQLPAAKLKERVLPGSLPAAVGAVGLGRGTWGCGVCLRGSS
jgi:CRP-like cAMP-binding protein